MLKSAARTALLAIAATSAVAAHAGVREDTVTVPALIAAYHEAVLGHDASRLQELFVPQGSAWFSVLSDAGLAQMRANKPDTPKVQPGSVAGFVRMVGSASATFDPRHTNLHVTSDGDVATVTFDFRFFINGQQQNSGAESWQLIRGADGWRIVSIVFSSNPSRK